jgi:hypothetical protein
VIECLRDLAHPTGRLKAALFLLESSPPHAEVRAQPYITARNRKLRPAGIPRSSCDAEFLSRQWQQRVIRDRAGRSHTPVHVRFAPSKLSCDGKAQPAIKGSTCERHELSTGEWTRRTDPVPTTNLREEPQPMKINVETTVAAPIEQVWRAYTTPAEIKQWNAASDDWHTTAAPLTSARAAPSPRAWRPRTAAWASISPGPTRRSSSIS